MKKILIILITGIMLLYPLSSVNAGSISISASSTSVTTGGKVKIYVKANGVAGKFSVTSSNGNVLSGGTNSVWIENESKTYEFTAKNIGSTTITIKSLDVADSNGNNFSDSKSIKINVVKPREKSTNNNLKSLEVEGFNLTPEFNSDVLEYSTEIDIEKTSINIKAQVADGYAHMDGTGEKEVTVGDNKFEIKVTSETGSEKIYVINAIVKDKNPIVKKLDDKDLTVIKKLDSIILPESIKELFEATQVKIDEIEVPAYKSEKLKITLVGLKDDKDNIYLYTVDENGMINSEYKTVSDKPITLLLENPKELLEDYKEVKVTINGKEYKEYQNDNKDYALVYGTNIENNETGWYLYNIKEESIQKYNDKMFDKLNKDFDREIKDYKTVILCLSGLSIFLLIVIILVALSKQKQKKKMKEKIEQFLEQTKELKKIDISEQVIENKKNQVNDEISEIKVEEDIAIENDNPKEEEKKKKEKKSKKEKKKTKKVEEPKEKNDEKIEEKVEEVIAVQVPNDTKNEEKEISEEKNDDDDDELSYEFLDPRARKKFQKKNLKK